MLKLSLYCIGLLAIPACAQLSDDATEHESELSGAARRPRSEAIRDIAASRGLTNGVLLAGIAQVETGLSHCWSEATWACQGPFSSFCGGPVIAGAGDGPCSAQQGGLGMFQFDGGTYAQTLARDGQGVLQLDGNIAHAVDFVAGIVRQEVAGVNSTADAIAWMNSVPVVRGNARFNQWTAILACRYNGRCSGTSGANQAALYGNATVSALGEFGAAFWQTSSGGGRPRVTGGDISGDGFADLLGARPDGTLWLYRNSTLAAPFSTGIQVGGGWAVFDKVFAGDVSGDGFADVVASKPDGTLWLYRNAGAATPDAPFSTGAQIGGGWQVFDKVFAADVTGDRFADLLATRPDGTLWLYRNAGAASPNGPYSTGIQVGAGWQIFTKVFAGDVDGDGFADVLGIRPDGTMSLYRNAGAATPSAPYATGALVGTGWNVFSRVLAVDLDNDHHADLVAIKPDGSMLFYRNSGNASSPYSTGVLIGTGWNIF